MSRTDDRYHCRACYWTGPADMDRDENLTCAMCDSPDVITESARIDELRAERIAENLAEDARVAQFDRAAFWDRIAGKFVAEPTYTEGCLLRRQAGGQ
ncbi:MAG TPA: hypothetical protein VGK73_07745 [Polyangiaceae bacterium]